MSNRNCSEEQFVADVAVLLTTSDGLSLHAIYDELGVEVTPTKLQWLKDAEQFFFLEAKDTRVFRSFDAYIAARTKERVVVQDARSNNGVKISRGDGFRSVVVYPHQLDGLIRDLNKHIAFLASIGVKT